MTNLIRAGSWQTVLKSTECDSLITDPPYSARVHNGQSAVRKALGYDMWTKDDVKAFVDAWAERTRNWMVCFTSHDLIGTYTKAYEAAGRYAFAPVLVVQKVPRFSGDGPSNWARYLMVSRPKTKEAMRWRALPGLYVAGLERGAPIRGAKPVSLMKALVRDYSDSNDLICDPCSGFGSTRLAALELERRFVGAEFDAKLCRQANEREVTDTKMCPEDLITENLRLRRRIARLKGES